MVLDAILPVVARSSNLALRLYQFAASSQEAGKQIVEAAKVINSFALALKQVGTTITENDKLPSPEALVSLEDIIDQARSVLSAIESAIQLESEQKGKHDGTTAQTESYFVAIGPQYLSAHLEALRATLSLQLQTLYTAQSIMWSKLRPTISPQQAAKTVENERLQLETLVIDQQVSMLCALRAYRETSGVDSRLLMETDSSKSLVSTEPRDGPNPRDLYKYQDVYLASLDVKGAYEAAWLPAVFSIRSAQAERLLNRWTSLPQFEMQLLDEERNAQKQRQETQQATVESDSEDETKQQSELAGHTIKSTPPRSGSVQPLFADPIDDDQHEHPASQSSATSPRQSRNSQNTAMKEPYSPATPRSSIGSLPVEAAAAMEAKEEDDDVDLEIPWTLCTRKHYWKYIDAKQIGSNTDQNPSLAFLERTSWTEITASWVCKEAIQEAGFRFTQVQKERKDGRRTKLETCFCIEKPLQFDQVKQLVERTVEIYRKTAPPTPPPSNARRSSYQRPPPVNLPTSKVANDHSRTQGAGNNQPTFKQANSQPRPPPLNRPLSVSGSEYFSPPYPPPKHQAASILRSPSLQIPQPPGGYTSQPTPRPQNGGHPPQNSGYPTQPMYTQSPQFSYPPGGSYSNSLPPQPPPHPFVGQPPPPPPSHWQSRKPTANGRYEDRDLTTSDSDSAGRDRARRHRSKSRSRYAPERKKKSHKTSKAVGALMGVGGLTALLDGLSGI